MKKFLLIAFMIVLLSGCKRNNTDNVIKKFSDLVSSSDSYHLKGKMSIISDEEEFNYTFDVKYLKDDYYKVTLFNTNNNHEQVILRSEGDVYVITPSLNKSFKFQSSWPNDSSQSYILASLLKDINNDRSDKVYNKDGKTYLIARVNYPNNSELVKEEIYFDKKANVKKVIVYDQDGNKRIITEFSKIDLKAQNDKSEFSIDEYIKNINNENSCTTEKCEEKAANIIDDIIYPLYLPSNTYLTNSERIGEDSLRVILTFSGEKNFTIVEDATIKSNEFEINPVFGNPIMLNDTIGVISDNSVSWSRGGIDYYLTSNNLTTSEMNAIASSMNHAVGVMESK